MRTGLLSLPNGMFKLYWHQEGCPGGDKHKVFKVDCPPPPVCEVVNIHYGPWECGEWSDCDGGEQTRECSREVWTTDKKTGEVCKRWTEPKTDSRVCGCNTACEVDSDCPGDYICYDDACRDEACPGQEDCVCEPPPLGPSDCNQPPTEAGCKKGLVSYVLPDGEIVCRNSKCLEKPSCICEVPCSPRLNIWVTGCFPEELKVSVWFEGNKIKDVPWDPSEGKPIIVDLDFNKTYTIKGWTEQGGFIELGSITTPKQCGPPIDFNYNFPCPVPTPTPTPELPRELPITGIGPPPSTLNLPDLHVVRAVGLALMVVGREILRKRK